jgi:hypothetical protein
MRMILMITDNIEINITNPLLIRTKKIQIGEMKKKINKQITEIINNKHLLIKYKIIKKAKIFK